MSDYQLVNFTNPDDFVEATKKYDDCWMNFAFGALMDSLDASQAEGQRRWGPQERTLVAVYKGDSLLVTLTKIAKDFSWVLSHPRDAIISEDEFPSIAQLLATSLPSILSPTTPPSSSDLLKLDKVIGPESLVDTFLNTWVSHLPSLNPPIHLQLIDPPYFQSRFSYATIETVPPPSPAFSSEKYDIALASTEEDALELASFYVEFKARGPLPATHEEGLAIMKDAIKGKRLWCCRLKDSLEPSAIFPEHKDAGITRITASANSSAIAGYVMVGRETPRTIAVRNVYVSPTFRRKGVAEALVRAVTRYYLDAQPLGFNIRGIQGHTKDDAEEGKLVEGVIRKQEVCLNVVDEGAKRLYIRCGFLLDDNARDPKSGRSGYFPSIWRGVKPIREN
ncbi:unnamed protein product [Somion occarium]|uniref:N-acetyltransferase domain-containing protein n=1 Tax=Somion occarium TaxID=3059160 RepID=A0ABP1DCR1_9APHY